MPSGGGRASATLLSNAQIVTEGAAAEGKSIQQPTTSVVPLSLQTINPKVRSSVSFDHSSLGYHSASGNVVSTLFEALAGLVTRICVVSLQICQRALGAFDRFFVALCTVTLFLELLHLLYTSSLLAEAESCVWFWKSDDPLARVSAPVMLKPVCCITL